MDHSFLLHMGPVPPPVSNTLAPPSDDIEKEGTEMAKKVRFGRDLDYFTVRQTQGETGYPFVDIPLWCAAGLLDLLLSIVLLWVVALRTDNQWEAANRADATWGKAPAAYGLVIDVILFGPKALRARLRLMGC